MTDDTPDFLSSAKTVREGVGALSEVLKLVTDSSLTQEAGRNLGRAAVTVSATLNTVLLPLAALNFGFEKAKAYFQRSFEKDLLDRTRDIPLESQQAPSPQIAADVIRGLSYSHEQAEIRGLYLSLLARAMDARSSELVHPAFVEITKQLEPEEIRLLELILRSEKSTAAMRARISDSGHDTVTPIATHIWNLGVNAGEKISWTRRHEAMVENWVRLGLVSAEYDGMLSGDETYSWLGNVSIFSELLENSQARKVGLTFDYGRISRTSFGIRYAKCAGVLDQYGKTEAPNDG